MKFTPLNYTVVSTVRFSKLSTDAITSRAVFVVVVVVVVVVVGVVVVVVVVVVVTVDFI
jgi:hypothetical protein